MYVSRERHGSRMGRARPENGITRRSVVTGIVAAAAAVSVLPRRYSDDAAIRLRFAHTVLPSHPFTLRLAEAAEKIHTVTDGDVAIDIFSSAQLGADTAVLGQVRSGAIELCSISGLVLSTLAPAASLCSLGFLYDDYETVWASMDGALGEYIDHEIEKAHIVSVGPVWDNGFRQITTADRHIENADNLRNLKIRVPLSPILTSTFKYLSAAPVSMNFAEVYTALQTGLVDGQENPLAIIDAGKLYEVQAFVSLTSHAWDGYYVLSNARFWARLPRDVRRIVTDVFGEYALIQRRDSIDLSGQLQQKLEQIGLSFDQPDKASFRDTLQREGYYGAWRERFGHEAWHVLETAVGGVG